MRLSFNEEIAGAMHFGRPIVALESTVISHGLPRPQNLETAVRLEKIIREAGAIPATVGVLDGEVFVGLNSDQMRRLATDDSVKKLSVRELALASARKLTGGTTVASTTLIAHAAGINVFATGGIGGVHRGQPFDVSADLPQLAKTPLIVVCSGPKAILDVAATREWLETSGVTVLGWRCDRMPAFYSASSAFSLDARVETPEDVSRIADARRELSLNHALLVTVPIPAEAAIHSDEVETYLTSALIDADAQGISGKDLTPFLLKAVADKSGGRTLSANIALLENNARVAAEIARALNY